MQDFRLAEVHELTDDMYGSLARLLIDVVGDGASIGFLPPLREEEAAGYWKGVLSPDVKLWVVYRGEEPVGSVQLHLCMKDNGKHRAEIAKLMVHPTARRNGLAKRLMLEAETAAREDGRSLLVLDTREGDPSNLLYQSLGYVEAGRIPRFARSANGQMDGTVIYYKELATV
ncbi:GNAT family N-acetyltransferase [Brevibacillus migulae]|uniref:GNAT family N-acetyltransferase n=1 Tax=Brevibacillus migulae TaxID=1644114 RepID=UPI002E2682F9